MSDAALSAEELAALRAASQSLGAEPSGQVVGSVERPAAPPPTQGPMPRRIELAAPDRQVRRRLPELEQRLVALQKSQRQIVSTVMRQSLDVVVEPLCVEPVARMSERVEHWLWGLVVRRQAGREPLFWVGLERSFGFHLVEIAYGGEPGHPGSLPERKQPTRIEQETITPFLRSVADALIRDLNLERLGPLEVAALPLPLALGKLRTQESGLLWRNQVPMATGSLPYDIILLPKALEELSTTSATSEARERAAKAESMATHVLAATVDAIANLGHTAMSVGELAGLAEGQVIWLDHNQADPIELLIAGQAKFSAMPMQRAGAVGVAILEKL